MNRVKLFLLPAQQF